MFKIPIEGFKSSKFLEKLCSKFEKQGMKFSLKFVQKRVVQNSKKKLIVQILENKLFEIHQIKLNSIVYQKRSKILKLNFPQKTVLIVKCSGFYRNVF